MTQEGASGGKALDTTEGQAVYNPLTLAVYDLYVTHFTNYFIWKCPCRHIQAMFQNNSTDRHLDVGVGTGYYLKNLTWPQGAEITLMDMNDASLKAAAKVLRGHKTTGVQADIYQRCEVLKDRFKSISANFLLHCLPGTMADKTVVIENLVDMLQPGGILFGSTVLSDTAGHGPVSRRLMALYNRKGIFGNNQDTQAGLKAALGQHLEDVDIKIIGCVALFTGRKK
mgnify:FL=1|tara:strand:+ start:483 stop:1160 length:678 start_codon:yes stop_codon:yes gene_type:complete